MSDNIPPPMSDEDAANAVARLSTLNSQQISKICDGFSQQLVKLINILKKTLNQKTDEMELVELDRLLRLIKLIPSDEVFIRIKDKLWAARDHILAKNSDWFLNRDYSRLIKKDKKQTMIETIINVVKIKYNALSIEEREFYWTAVFNLLNTVSVFKKLTGEK
jgi:hypothetical protein